MHSDHNTACAATMITVIVMGNFLNPKPLGKPDTALSDCVEGINVLRKTPYIALVILLLPDGIFKSCFQTVHFCNCLLP